MEFPGNFDTQRCVLFLGSGFSAAAVNKRNENPPLGEGLKHEILSEVNEENLNIELKDAATYAADQGADIYRVLHDLFVITKLNDDQKDVLKKQWRRIYTTNYDDAVELFGNTYTATTKRRSFSIDDDMPRKLPANSIIHLHGYIHTCDRNNILSQLVLDHHSYATQAVLDSPWWGQFERDIQGAQWVFFVGYNLNDFSVAKYLTMSPKSLQKTRFILRSPVKKPLLSRLKKYGTVDAIGVSGFAKACDQIETGEPISSFHQLQAFQLIDPYKDNKSVVRPTPVEIETLLTRGNYNFQTLSSTYPKPLFALPRGSKMQEAWERLKISKTLLLHSRTANGKSIFADMLSLDLSEKGKRCVRYNSHSDIPPSEIDFLSKFDDIVVFFRIYDDLVAVREDVSALHSKTSFVVEIQTGIDQVRRTEVNSHLPSPIQRLDLNRLERSDRQGLRQLLDHAGIPANAIDLSGEGHTELRDHLIELLNSPHVKMRLDQEIKPLLDDKEAMKVITTACVMSAFSIHVGMDFIRTVTDGDPFDILSRNKVVTFEFGLLTPESLALHSAVFSGFFLTEYVRSEDIVEIIYGLALESAKRIAKDTDRDSQRCREARQALGSLLQYRKLSSILSVARDTGESIAKLYEDLRYNDIINGEPLFWLQYSIFMKDKSNFRMARSHLVTAYSRADNREGFRTYQLDTNYLSLILQAPVGEDDFPGDTEVLFDLIDKVHNMLVAQDNRKHAIRVLEYLKMFCSQHGEALTQGERQRLSLQCMSIAKTLDAFEINLKTEFGTEKSKVAVQEAVALLAKYE